MNKNCQFKLTGGLKAALPFFMAGGLKPTIQLQQLIKLMGGPKTTLPFPIDGLRPAQLFVINKLMANLLLLRVGGLKPTLPFFMVGGLKPAIQDSIGISAALSAKHLLRRNQLTQNETSSATGERKTRLQN